jgi:prepilin-type N-terminal cleavage/methylation domain-containing protein
MVVILDYRIVSASSILGYGSDAVPRVSSPSLRNFPKVPRPACLGFILAGVLRGEVNSHLQRSAKMHGMSHKNLLLDRGFTLVELLLVVGVVGVVLATAVPVVQTAAERFTFNSAARSVGAEIRSTRYAAVAKNRTQLLRFNCPGPGEFRMVEFTADATLDYAADRCSSATYPYPDSNPGVAPDTDGPVRRLPEGIAFSQASTLVFDPTGRIPTVVTVEVNNGRQRRTIIVQTSGRVAEQ